MDEEVNRDKTDESDEMNQEVDSKDEMLRMTDEIGSAGLSLSFL